MDERAPTEDPGPGPPQGGPSPQGNSDPRFAADQNRSDRLGSRDSSDPLIGELRREQRHRLVLVVAAVVGIISGTATGMASVLGALGVARAPIGARSPGLLVFFVGPPILCMAIGYAIFALLRRRR